MKQQLDITTAVEDRLRKEIEVSQSTQAELDRQIERTQTAERRLEGTQQLVAAIAESLGEGVYAFDLGGRITYVNPAAERMFGCNARETNRHLQHSARIPLLAVKSGMVVHQDDERFTRCDGTHFSASYTSSPILSNGQVIGGVVAFRDTTERKDAEEALRKSEKLSSAGKMAAAMAHEINNPLAAITNLLYLLESEELQGTAREYLTLAENELQRIARITRQHLHFYRESSKPVAIDLGQILDEVVAMNNLNSSKFRDIEIRKEYEVIASVQGFPGEMRQLFSNLIENAAEAKCSRITIRMCAAADWKNPKRRGVRITVGDDASGINREHLDKIFDPFFTTKGEKGSGLGLWVCRGIVQKHEGTIHVSTSTKQSRHGTVFSVFLPTFSVKKTNFLSSASSV